MMIIEADQSIDAGTADTSSSSNVPKVDKRSAKTTLLMEDGQIVIMGGLRKKEKQIITSQVPLFGDLPLIGFLFSNNKEVTKTSELIVMISPHIQNGNGLNDKQMEKFNELKNRPMLSLPKDEFRPTE
jgi:type II secretory pathway component GspD/PulD (secretin)